MVADQSREGDQADRGRDECIPPAWPKWRAAKADGRWEAAYPAQSQAVVPEDFQAALDDNPVAKRFFESLTGSTRYAFLYRLHDVREPQRRAKRIADYIDRLSASRTLQD